MFEKAVRFIKRGRPGDTVWYDQQTEQGRIAWKVFPLVGIATREGLKVRTVWEVVFLR
jgi:hypothetical protein